MEDLCLYYSANFKLNSKLGHILYVGYNLCVLYFRHCTLIYFICLSVLIVYIYMYMYIFGVAFNSMCIKQKGQRIFFAGA